MDPSLLCKVFFTAGSVVAIGGTLIPSFREDIMNYGSRKADSKNSKKIESKSIFRRIFDLAASLQVPHTWFTHYYAVSVASSFFWGFQIMQHGRLFQLLASYSSSATSFMTTNQVFLAWTLMMVQGSRRLAESLTLMKPSKAKMWIGLWILGSLFYFFIGIGIWIEGIRAVDKKISFSDLTLSVPSLKSTVAIPLFVAASWAQYICHEHLANLEKYSLPHHPFFQSILCPHYACECLIYLAIAIVSAPQGQLLNGTVTTGLMFVASNLAVTADSTQKWYLEKFGQEAVGGRWKMVPFMY